MNCLFCDSFRFAAVESLSIQGWSLACGSVFYSSFMVYIWRWVSWLGGFMGWLYFQRCCYCWFQCFMIKEPSGSFCQWVLVFSLFLGMLPGSFGSFLGIQISIKGWEISILLLLYFPKFSMHLSTHHIPVTYRPWFYCAEDSGFCPEDVYYI